MTYEELLGRLEPVLSGKKGMVFDLDGTLLDSMGAWRELDSDYMQQFGIEVDDAYKKAIAAMTLPMASEYISKTYHEQIPYTPKEVEAQLMERMILNYREKLLVKPHVPMLLKELKKRGFSMMVATANEYELCEAALVRNQVFDYFDGIITCTMAGAGKEFPTVYIKACEMMGIDVEDAIVFEDTLHSVKTAKSADFTVVAVYDEDAKASWEEIKSLADLDVEFE